MFIRSFTAPFAIAATLLASTAMAEVTAQQVWDDWKANMDLYGDTGLTIGSEVAGPGTVTVTDIAMSMDDGDMTVDANMGNLVFTENGDGTVSVTMSEEYPIVMTWDDYNGDPSSSLSMALRQTGLTMTVSGDPSALSYDMRVQRYALELTEITEYDEVIPVTAFLALNNLTGTYTSTPGALRGLDYALSATTVDLLFDVNLPEEDAVVNVAGQIADLSLNAAMTIPEGLDFAGDPQDMDVSGLDVSGGYTFGGMAYTADVDVDGEQLAGTATAEGGSLDFAFSEAGVSYDTMLSGLNVSAQTIPDFPFPVDVSIAEYGVGFAMPLSRSDEPQDVRTSITLSGLTVNDEIWGLVDPAGQLGRDPITAQIAVSGQMKWLFDLLDPAQQSAMNNSDMPAEIYALNIDTLQLNALGAEVTGGGAFTFDNTDLNTIPGVPRPQGQANVVVTGANQLMDTLVSMGLIAEEDSDDAADDDGHVRHRDRQRPVDLERRDHADRQRLRQWPAGHVAGPAACAQIRAAPCNGRGVSAFPASARSARSLHRRHLALALRPPHCRAEFPFSPSPETP